MGALQSVFSHIETRGNRNRSRSRSASAWLLSSELGNVPWIELSSSARLHDSSRSDRPTRLPEFSVLWQREFGSAENDAKLVPIILRVVEAIREAYRPLAPPAESRQASDTLVTKIILGTMGCLPACDRYFIDGFKSCGLKYSCLNVKFVERALQFSRDNLTDFHEERERIQRLGGIRNRLQLREIITKVRFHTKESICDRALEKLNRRRFAI